MESLESLAGQLEAGKEALLDALAGCGLDEFSWEGGGSSLRHLLEGAVDALNLRFGRLVAAALGLPPTPCIVPAQLSSPREAAMVLQVAHRRLLNLLHLVGPQDLERAVVSPEGERLTLAQVLAQVVQAYRGWAEEVRALRKAYASLQGEGDGH
jgi:hypothetical protein